MKTRMLAVVVVLAACGGGIPQDQFQSEEYKTFCHKYAECGEFSSEAANDFHFATPAAGF